ncbi:molybdopterin molybdotransferase MoeA [Paenarthrobacter sp. DKR-5]|uniref:molybdopterin molybdotransferase MoeA n=1 Tax=Paenarthrobacter sp. DKR-5 TaxID=2835535 RepID=UPI001BDBEE7F|nr:molybdopterin molybdotransferase MoeA [Paenarthrobacter sp. DKR-5]
MQSSLPPPSRGRGRATRERSTVPRSVSAHQEAVRSLLQAPLSAAGPAAELPLARARGLVLARDVTAPVSLPPFANSQMDGFAVRSADLAAGRPLPVAEPVPAGADPGPLRPGWAAPVMTGAKMPAGADAVVPVERADPPRFPDASAAAEVLLPQTAPGTYVREPGSDIAAGARALPAGTVLGPAQLGLLAALGLTTAPVRDAPAPRVLLVATGDEVVAPGTALPEGKIFDANGTILHAALAEAGVEVVDGGLVPDDPGVLRQLIREYAPSVDLVLTTGGVSMGAYEVVRQAMADQPVDFLSVAMQPGGPQGIGTVDGTAFLGFPGNPVSALVSFEMFLRPALSELRGLPQPRPVVRARLAERTDSPPNKHQVRRGVYAEGTVRLVGGPGSHLVSALAASNALVHIPEGRGAVEAGEDVTAWLL